MCLLHISQWGLTLALQVTDTYLHSTGLRVSSPEIFYLNSIQIYLWKITAFGNLCFPLIFLHIIGYDNVSWRPHEPHPKIWEQNPQDWRLWPCYRVSKQTGLWLWLIFTSKFIFKNIIIPFSFVLRLILLSCDLQLSKSVLAQWPLRCIRWYECTGRGRFTIETGNHSSTGAGRYVFKTRVGQDSAIYDRIDSLVNEQTRLQGVSGWVFLMVDMYVWLAFCFIHCKNLNMYSASSRGGLLRGAPDPSTTK